MTDLEFLEQYARCGIHHNHAHNESNLKHKIQIMDAAVSAIDLLYSRLEIAESKVDELTEQLNEQSVNFVKFLKRLEKYPSHFPARRNAEIEEMINYYSK